jgi:predicted nucleic acid-binding protein
LSALLLLSRYCRAAIPLKSLSSFSRPALFNYSPDVASAIVHEIELIAQILAAKRHIAVIQADPDDNMVLECGIAGGADYIVSGDVHLLAQKGFEGIRIVTPAEFLKVLEYLHE